MTTLLAMIVLLTPQRDADSAAEVRVMSFNIRYGSARDGANRWELRKDLLVETIRAFDPDILGTQETLAFQRDDLAGNLPGFELLAAGRDDGEEKGEMMALYYRADRFERLDGGHFWLSESPDEVGSSSWDSSLPRMVTWVELRDRETPDAPTIAAFNTHFDHRGPQARLESARLLRRKIAELAPDSSVIVTGDFNCGEGSEPYRALFEDEADQTIRLIDTYRAAHPEPTEAEGTYSDFKAESTGGARIDWIACSPDWDVRSAAIDRSSRDGRTPSDHFPITAILRPRASSRDPETP